MATVAVVTSPPQPDPGASYRPPNSYPGPAGYPQPPYPPRPTTSRWAIAALVLSLLSCVPLGVIFGIIALVKTKDGRQSGRGLAIAGIAISGAWVVVAAVIAVIAMLGNRLVTGTEESGRGLTVGQCVDETPQSPRGGIYAGSSTPRGCDQPHSDEVFAVLSMGRPPESDSDDDELRNRCTAELRKYSPSASNDPDVRVVIDPPSAPTWRYGSLEDRRTVCLAHFTSNRVGSIKG